MLKALHPILDEPVSGPPAPIQTSSASPQDVSKIVLALMLSVFATMLGIGIVAPLLPMYASWKGASRLEVGLIFASFPLSRMLFAPLAGRWADRYNRKRLILTGLLIYIVCSLAYCLTISPYPLSGIRFCQGMGSTLVMPVAMAIMGELAPPGKAGSFMGLINLALMGGISLGPFLGGMFMDLWGMNSAFMALGFCTLVGFMFCLTLLPPDRLGGSKSIRTVPQRVDSSGTYRSLLANRAFRGIFLSRFAISMCYSAVWAFLPLFASEKLRQSPTKIGLLLTMNVMIAALMSSPVGRLADRFNRRHLVLIGIGFLIWSFGFLVLATGFDDLVWSNLLMGLSGGCVIPPLMAIVTEIGREQRAMGRAMSLVDWG
ncbi:MAG: MFS transporter [Deltaproteobacteria bacterium]|nr:MFS transporter [Deltaproteobacteria bacterium]